jgi:hypothetical protein
VSRPADPATYEKLGAFYLGRSYDLAGGKLEDELVLYDSKDLTTHAVCVGMTGSGKTGLCIALLEEAAIDGIPALVIDPKGDLTNLLLTFPDLAADDFAPWINEDDARRQGKSAAQYAGEQAELWRNGLTEWGQDGGRIARLKTAADFTVFTPGSSAGVPVSILSSLAAPPAQLLDDADLYRDRVAGVVTSLLGLLGIDADPLRSREHILLSTIVDNAWREGRSLDLGALIRLVQTPPVQRVGVLDVESFFPADDRLELSMALNNLLASPGFAAWSSGEPLDADRLLYTPEGKPRVSILSIAHLSDSERMFFVSLLLNELLGWMRTRPGTTSLRALLYMDELFGYMPPVAEPPSKKPLLTILKQGRAFGVGAVLATQNPVDLDYKGLSNCGTWFIGRLQTERDKNRVLDGLEGVTAGDRPGFDRAAMERTLAGLGKRVFLMHNVHESAPAIFHTRWVMSYLRGPLTRPQIRRLMHPPESTTAAGGPTGVPKPAAQAAAAPAAAPPAGVEDAATDAAGTKGASAAPTTTAPPSGMRQPDVTAQPPLIGPDVPQCYLPVLQDPPSSELAYSPGILGAARVAFVDRRKGIETSEELTLLATVDDGPLALDWGGAEPIGVDADGLLEAPAPSAASFDDPPAEALDAKSYGKWKKSFADWLYRNRTYELLQSPALGEISEPGEDERAFRIRLAHRAREERDLQTEKLRKKYASKFRTLRERIRRAEEAVQREKEQASGARMQTAISLGSTLLSAVLGRSALGSRTLGKATTTARGVSRASRQAQDVERARAKLAAYQTDLEDLEASFQQDVAALEEKLDPAAEEFETVTLTPRRADVDVRLVALAWAPFARDADGGETPLYASAARQ